MVLDLMSSVSKEKEVAEVVKATLLLADKR
jgi:hypothetical protein